MSINVIIMNTTPVQVEDSNLWKGGLYVAERSSLIVLPNTYEGSTKQCMEDFLRGEPDLTFLMLVGGVICRGFLREEKYSVLAKIAITNFIERIPESNDDKPTAEDCDKSRGPFRRRVERLKPCAALVLGSETCGFGKKCKWPLPAIEVLGDLDVNHHASAAPECGTQVRMLA
jgi:hypothetical protein